MADDGPAVRRTCPVFPQAGSPLVWQSALTLTGCLLPASAPVHQTADDAITLPPVLQNRFHDESGWISVIAAVFILVFFLVYTASGFVSCAKLFVRIRHPVSGFAGDRCGGRYLVYVCGRLFRRLLDRLLPGHSDVFLRARGSDHRYLLDGRPDRVLLAGGSVQSELPEICSRLVRQDSAVYWWTGIISACMGSRLLVSRISLIRLAGISSPQAIKKFVSHCNHLGVDFPGRLQS